MIDRAATVLLNAFGEITLTRNAATVSGARGPVLSSFFQSGGPAPFAGSRQDFAAFRMRRCGYVCGKGFGTDADLMSFDSEEGHASRLQRQPQLRLRRPMQTVPIALIVADRAARHARAVRKIHLRPVKEAAGCSAERWCQNHHRFTLTQGSMLPILGDICHIGQNLPVFQGFCRHGSLM